MYYYYYYVNCTSHYSHYQTTIPTTPPPTNTLSHIYTHNLYMYDIFIHQYRVYLFYNMAGIIVFGKVELKYILYCMFGPESTASYWLCFFTCHPIHDMGPILLIARRHNICSKSQPGLEPLTLWMGYFTSQNMGLISQRSLIVPGKCMPSYLKG